MFPQDKECEVCGNLLRVLPFPDMHILCPKCSQEVHARIGQRVKDMYNACIAGLQESGFGRNK